MNLCSSSVEQMDIRLVLCDSYSALPKDPL